MKKIHFIIGILALAVCGCVKEDIVADAPAEEMVKVRLSTAEPPVILGAETRTVLNEDLSVEWNADDKVLMCSNTYYATLANVAGGGPLGIFEGTISKEMLTSTAPEIVVYPGDVKSYSPNLGPANWGWGLSKLPVRAEQELVSGSFGRGANTSVAVFKLEEGNDPLHFKNICGLLKVSLYGKATVKSVAITSPGNLTGMVTMQITGNSTGEKLIYLLNELSEESETVTLTSAKGVDLNNEKHDFYACVLPGITQLKGSTDNAGAIAGDYVVTVTTVEGKVATKTFSMEEDLGGGELFELGEMEVNYDFTDAAGRTFILDPTGVESKKLPYNPADGTPVVTCPSWVEYEIDETDGMITFDGGIYVGIEPRVAEVTITLGDKVVVFSVYQEPCPPLKHTELYCDADAHADYEVEKSEYLSGTYVFETPDWLTAVQKENGNILVSAAANTTGAERTGEVVIKVDGSVAGKFTVTQVTFNYETLAGDYNFDFWQRGYYNNKAQNKTVTMSVQPDGESYKVIIGSASSDKYKYSMIMTYTSIGTTPAFLSLICPQDTEYTNNLNGWLTESEVHVAKKSSLSTAPPDGQGQNSIRIDDEGTGCDLVHTVSEGAICFDFVPNALTQELYPEGISGLCFPGMGTNNGTTKLIDLDWMTPLEGQEYLRIVKK